MPNLTVCYPSSKGTPTQIDYLMAGDIFEWQEDFWIMTDSGDLIVSLTRGERLYLNDDNSGWMVIPLNDARLYPYGE